MGLAFGQWVSTFARQVGVLYCVTRVQIYLASLDILSLTLCITAICIPTMKATNLYMPVGISRSMR